MKALDRKLCTCILQEDVGLKIGSKQDCSTVLYFILKTNAELNGGLGMISRLPEQEMLKKPLVGLSSCSMSA